MVQISLLSWFDFDVSMIEIYISMSLSRYLCISMMNNGFRYFSSLKDSKKKNNF